MKPYGKPLAKTVWALSKRQAIRFLKKKLKKRGRREYEQTNPRDG
jgi:hypothetical protein